MHDFPTPELPIISIFSSLSLEINGMLYLSWRLYCIFFTLYNIRMYYSNSNYRSPPYFIMLGNILEIFIILWTDLVEIIEKIIYGFLGLSLYGRVTGQ